MSLWFIGGSDGAGDAGVQTDLRIAQDIGVTARLLSPEQLVQPLSEGSQPNVIKIGLLETPQQVSALASWLDELRAKTPLYVILDPVITSSSEALMQLPDLVEQISEELLPRVDLLITNPSDWQRLLQARQITEEGSVQDQYSRWRRVSDPEVYLKAEQAERDEQESVTDLWLTAQRTLGFSAPNRAAQVRGAGCALGSALAAYRALGFNAEDALTLAFAYLQGAFEQSTPASEGGSHLGEPGRWPQPHTLPQITPGFSQGACRFPTLNPDSLGLYPVVDSLEWIERLIGWGVITLQLRIKGELTDAGREQIRQAIHMAKEHQVQLFINDHWQYAIEQGAYGIHLGQEDLEVADLAAIAQAGIRLGVSTHGFFEIARVMALQPSYVALGHIFPTRTKDMPSAPQGIERLVQYQKLLSGRYPTVAIGGINEARVPQVLKTGVNSIALVTAITEASDPKVAVERLQVLMKEGAA